MQRELRARERLPKGRVSRSGARPEPTVIVRMKENVCPAALVEQQARA